MANTMTNTLLRRLSALLLASGVAVGISLSSTARAEELRIGSLAPMTGDQAAVGKDMHDGFQMYLDDVKKTSPAPR